MRYLKLIFSLLELHIIQKFLLKINQVYSAVFLKALGFFHFQKAKICQPDQLCYSSYGSNLTNLNLNATVLLYVCQIIKLSLETLITT